MGKTITITSGKGGVAKTTTCVAFAAELAKRDFTIAAIDFDVGLRKLDLAMGCERRVVYDFIDVIRGEVQIQQALIRDRRLKNLFILPASQTRDKDALTKEGVEKVLSQLKQDFDYVLCDSPAGIERGAHLAMYFADIAIIVANPEISSVRDSDRMLGILSSKSQRAEQNLPPISTQLLLTRYAFDRVHRGEMLSVEDVLEILRIPLLGVIPESQAVLRASNTGTPVTLLPDNNDAKQAYQDAVGRLLGEEIPQRFIKPERKGFLSRLLSGKS